MNYLDEGQGRPIVFVHGNMTWSFMFRRSIEALQETHRCIAIDHLGFGLSDKPNEANYFPEGHARRFALFMKHLGLKDVTLVLIGPRIIPTLFEILSSSILICGISMRIPWRPNFQK
jgi:pimeloyl-ACP methyl ester carboxylesterase